MALILDTRDNRAARAGATRTPAWMWLALALLSILIQGWYLADTATTPAFAYPLIDSASYHEQAQAIVDGKTPHKPFWQPPLYPYFLSVVYRLVGTDMIAVRAVHGLLGLAACLLTFGLARRFLAAGWAFGVGVAFCLYAPLIYFFSELLPVGLGIVLDLAVLLVGLWAMEKPGAWRWLACGVVLGLAVLAVPTVLIFVAVLVAAAWFAGADGVGESRPWRRVLALLLGVAVVIVPVTVRNRVVGGEWVLISTNGGINFFIGNNAHTDVTLATRPGLDWERLVRLPYQQGAVTAKQAERFFYAESAAFARRHPLEFVGGMLVKALQYVNGREIPRNLDMYVVQDESTVLGLLSWRVWRFGFPFGVLGPLALFGLVVAQKNRRYALLAAFLILYSAGVIAFFPAARYRAPVLPALLVLAGGAACWFATRLRAGRVPLGAWVGLGVLVVLVNVPLRFPTDEVNFAAELKNAVGTAIDVRGDHRAAAAYYRQAIALDPQFADAHYNLGNALRLMNQVPVAEASYREAIRIRPDHDKARVNLGVALYQQRRYGEATLELEMAATLNPRNAQAYNNLAVVQLALGRRQEALANLREAARLDPVYVPSLRQFEAVQAAKAALVPKKKP